jgi:2-oxoisovalerate dehydrogenase E1 component
MPGACIDGMNPVAVKSAVREARSGWLPCFVEAETYRYFHHGGKIPGSAFGYRDKQEESLWKAKDPVVSVPEQLVRLGILDEEQHQTLRSNAVECICNAVENCTSSRERDRVFLEELWPSLGTLTDELRDDSVFDLGLFVEKETVECARKVRYSDAIAESMGYWLARDPTVIVMGEEVANMKGGAYGATRGLPDRFPDRILNTPISEAGFCGLAAGAAMNGMHPVVEIMYSSFLLVAADQIFNQIGQLSHIYGGAVDLPLVLRVRIATGSGFGAQHSLDPAALFHLFPGWRIFAPTTPFDYVGLFNVAMNSRRPTVVLEHQMLYGRKGSLPDDPLDYLVRPGRAKVIRPGKELTLVTYSATTLQALEAARLLAEEGVDVEIIDLRTLDRSSTDFDSLGESLRKTGRLLTVEQAPRCGSIGAHIIAECVERFDQHLKSPPRSLAGPSVPIPVSKPLENECLPDAARICQVIREYLNQ